MILPYFADENEDLAVSILSKQTARVFSKVRILVKRDCVHNISVADFLQEYIHVYIHHRLPRQTLIRSTRVRGNRKTIAGLTKIRVINTLWLCKVSYNKIVCINKIKH